MFTFPASNSSSYSIPNSIRFNGSSSYMSRTVGTNGNRRTCTWSGWVKRGKLTSIQMLFAASIDANNYFLFYLSSDALVFASAVAAADGGSRTSVNLLRDPSAWYHIILQFDATATTAKIYVNGVEITYTGSTAVSNQDYCINLTTAGNYLGRDSRSAANYHDGYLSEINFIDGQALTPSSFGATDPTTGQWKPKKYTGTYGTNGFYLPFNDGSSTTTLGYDRQLGLTDSSKNNWTLTSFTRSAGVSDCWMTDTPTNNYATGNPLLPSGATWSNGALGFSIPNGTGNFQTSVAVTSGKWYWEALYTAQANDTGIQEVGLLARNTSAITYASTGVKLVNGASSAYGASYTTGDVIGVALDMTGGTVEFYKNNASQGSISISGLVVNAVATASGGGGAASTGNINFGQRSFTYTPPTGYKALCTANLPTPAIANPKLHFDIPTWTGNNANNRSIATNCQADLVWIKDRSTSMSHIICDSVRGSNKYISSNTTGAEITPSDYGAVGSFSSTGFTLVDGTVPFETTYQFAVNMNTASYPNRSYVGFVWKAGGAAVSNTAGSITSQVSANTTAGFSIVTYTGTGANATVGHGLGVAPKMVICKARAGTGYSWNVWHTGLANTEFLLLESTNAKATDATKWNSTSPTSTVFSLGSAGGVNENTRTYVSYVFAEVAGFSKAFSFTGNANADGPMVWLGFRPKYVLLKNASAAATDWVVLDTLRNLYNKEESALFPNSSSVETTNGFYDSDFVSNGFKLRSANSNVNGSGNTIIGMAFAEYPFNYANAR